MPNPSLTIIHAGGMVLMRELHGEKLLVDTGCLVAFTSGITYDIQAAGGLTTMIFGGEELFLVTLQGHGKVWLQPVFLPLVHVLRPGPSSHQGRRVPGDARPALVDRRLCSGSRGIQALVTDSRSLRGAVSCDRRGSQANHAGRAYRSRCRNAAA